MTFDGCRTTAEAETRLRLWLMERAADARRKLVSDLLTNNDLDLDLDGLDAFLDADTDRMHGEIERAVAVVREKLLAR